MHTTAPGSGPGPAQDETSLGELLQRVLHFYQCFGRPVLLIALLAAIGAATWVTSRPLYTVTALLEVPDINLEEWRQAQSFLWDERWVDQSFAGPTDSGLPSPLKRLALNPAYWASVVQYRPSLMRDDVRDIPATEFQKARGLGLAMSLRVRNQSQADQFIKQLTHHIREALLANRLISLVRDGEQELARRPQLHLELLQTQFDIQQAQQRVTDMRQLLEHYPELRTMDANTVVSVSDGGGKYLGPLPQIVALEATISELQGKSRRATRVLERLDWTQQLLAGMDVTIRTATSGEQIIDQLRSNREKLLAANPTLTPTAQEATQQLDLTLALTEARQQAIGIKAQSAVSFSPVNTRNPKWVAIAVFAFVFTTLSLLMAAHVILRRGRPVLAWLPQPLRRWLIIQVQP